MSNLEKLMLGSMALSTPGMVRGYDVCSICFFIVAGLFFTNALVDGFLPVSPPTPSEETKAEVE